jgi:hypothetical protein
MQNWQRYLDNYGYDFLVKFENVCQNSFRASCNIIVRCFRKTPVQILVFMMICLWTFGSAYFTRRGLPHYLSHLYCHSVSAARLCRKHCKYLRKLYIIYIPMFVMRPSGTAIKNVQNTA